MFPLKYGSQMLQSKSCKNTGGLDMSGPKSSTYHVDPQILRERMLDMEHRMNMEAIKRSACEKADLIMSRMLDCSFEGSIRTVDKAKLQSVRELIKQISYMQSKGINNDRLANIREKLTTINVNSLNCNDNEINAIKNELNIILSDCVQSGIIELTSSSDPNTNIKSKAEQFEEELQKRNYRQAVEEMLAQSILAEKEVDVPEYNIDNVDEIISAINNKTEELKAIRKKEIEREYIYTTACSVMEQMGYTIIGEKNSNKGVRFRSSLFKINDEAAFSITQSANGSVVYEVVGTNDTGVLTEDMVNNIETVMKSLCGKEYDRFLELMKENGVEPEHNGRRLPPDRSFVVAKRVSDYIAPVSKPENIKDTLSNNEINNTVKRKNLCNGTN